jgi:hypothetical protein
MAIKAVPDRNAHKPATQIIGRTAPIQAKPAHIGLPYGGGWTAVQWDIGSSLNSGE